MGMHKPFCLFIYYLKPANHRMGRASPAGFSAGNSFTISPYLRFMTAL